MKAAVVLSTDQPALRYWPTTALREHVARYGHHCYLRDQIVKGITCCDVTTSALYDVEFDDGTTLCAFADELEIVR